MRKGSIVVLTGAGISAESGIKTFRENDGLWENHRLEDVASPEGYHRDPELVHAFYNARRAQLLSPELRPNPAHDALARLEREWPGEFLLVTQNVDNLHERAGSKNLIHMHGELLKARCARNGKTFEWKEALSLDTECPGCAQKKCLRPHIVWFGEMPLEMPRIYQALEECSIFVSIGTSGHVYPAAGFVDVLGPGARTVEINLAPSAVSSAFEEQLFGPAGEILPRWVEELLRA